MAGIPNNPTIDVPTHFVHGVDYEAAKITFRFLIPTPLMHSCLESHTYVLDVPGIRGTDDRKELLYDLHQLDLTPLPYGQIVFLSYYRNGEFLLEAATDRFKPHLVEEAFRSFGYTEVKMDANYVSVSEKDHFKLKLKYGI